MTLDEALARRDVVSYHYHQAWTAVDHLRQLGLSSVSLELTTWRGIAHACARELSRCDNSIESHARRARIVERVLEDSNRNERERLARTTRHDHRDYDVNTPENWPSCLTCGANSCDCGRPIRTSRA